MIIYTSAGTFDQAGSVAARSLAEWNGTIWEEVGGGTNGTVMVIKAVSGGMYVGGTFTQVGGSSANNIVYRDFQTISWVTLGSGVDDTVYAMEFEPISNSWFVGGAFFNAGGVSAIRNRALHRRRSVGSCRRRIIESGRKCKCSAAGGARRWRI